MKNPPNIKLEWGEAVEQPEDLPEYLKLDRRIYRFTYPDGISKEMSVDVIQRKNNDAVVIVAYDNNGIYFRSCIRPAIYRIFPELGNMWELAAGLIENDETPIETAIRETKEELGFEVTEADCFALGQPTFPSPGIICERIFLFAINISGKKQNLIINDGTPMEHYGEATKVSFRETFSLINNGKFDMKTELGCRRLLSFLEGLDFFDNMVTM